jgi:hypothetical protein
MKRYVIGIDCGVKTGLAVWDRKEKQFAEIETYDFWSAFFRIFGKADHEETLIFVEDPSKNKPVFIKKGVHGGRQALKIAQNVGGVKRESQLMIDGLKHAGYEVKAVRPKKGSMTKLKAEAFKQITGYTGRTNEHTRDAAMLVFGR